MAIRGFGHVSARSLGDAAAIAARSGRKAVFVAGGTDVLGFLKDRVTRSTRNSSSISNPLPISPSSVSRRTASRSGPSRPSPKSHKTRRFDRNTPCWPIPRAPWFHHRSGTWAPSAGTSARNRVAGTTGPRKTVSIASARAVKSAMRSPGETGSTPYSAPFAWVSRRARRTAPAASTSHPTSRESAPGRGTKPPGSCSAATGRVCPHFCERSYNRSELNSALSVRAIERSSDPSANTCWKMQGDCWSRPGR